MGFAGRLRSIFKRAKTASTGVVDTAKLSANLISEAKLSKVANLTELFTTDFVKLGKGNKAFIGAMHADDFVKYTRLGDYGGSFGTAYKNTRVLQNRNVQSGVKKVLSEAAQELPDARLLNNAKGITKGREVFKVTKPLNTASELDSFVKGNSKLNKAVTSTVKKANKVGALKLFGYTIAITAGVFTVTMLYDKAVQESKRQSGCMLFTTVGNNISSCKVQSLSCKYPNDGVLCLKTDVPADLYDATACKTNESEKDKDCAASQCKEELWDLQDNQALRCESKTPGDIVIEAVNQAGFGVTNAIGSTVKNLLIWAGVGIVLLIVLSIVLRFFGGGR